MSYTNLTLSFQGQYGDADGGFVRATFSNILESAVDTFKTWIDAHTDCSLISETVSETTETGVAKPSNGSNTDIRMVCFFRDATNGKTVKATVYAPLATDYEETPSGTRATSAFMTEFAQKLGTLKNGLVLTPLYGYVKQVR